MYRSSLILAGAALMCSTAFAQHQIDPARRVPITAPVKYAGTLNVTTGEWTRSKPGTTKVPQTIFNNTCTWTTAAYYAGFGECEDSYDEGRVPSADNSFGNPAGLTGTNPSQLLTSIQIAYCVYNDPPPAGPGAGAGINMELAIWNKLNGNCIGGQPVTHGSWLNPLATDYYLNLAGAGLPGTQTSGTQACWIVTLDTSGDGFTLKSDGDGVFDNLDDQDKFIWGKRINDQTPAASPNGFFLSGEPSKNPGSCSYNIACATDPLSPFGAGAPCGTGLGAWDGSWINVDGVGAGASGVPASPCLPGVAAYGYGTNCYYFGGYPTNVFDSYWLVLEGEGGAGAPQFCTSKPTSVPNCTPTLSIGSASIPKGGAPGSVSWAAAPAPGGGNPGIFIFNRVGPPNPPVLTGFGFICVIPFLRAGAFPQLPGGSPSTCTGGYGTLSPVSADFQTIVNGTVQIVAGDTTYWQLWYRDSANPGGANMTNAVGPITH